MTQRRQLLHAYTIRARHGRNGNLWIYLVVRANGVRRFPLPDDGDGTECLP